MCGIAGILGTPDATAAVIPHMMRAITHRGPDDFGSHVGDSLAVGATRLSIIDPIRGHQPMWTNDESVGIVYNGEVYNAHELGESLSHQGTVLRTHCDTEIVLEAYVGGGHADLTAMLLGLRGMFAFAIIDHERQRLVLARDRFGVKPLYYRVAADGTLVSFGSEIKSLLADPRCPRDVNPDALVNYLSLQYNPLPETLVTGIFRLPPASFATVDLPSGRIAIHRYWSYALGEQVISEESLEECIRDTVTDSVSRHLISDVPVGAFLSGGVDSAIVVSLAQERLEATGGQRLKTFTLGFDTLDECAEAREVADRFGTEHHEIRVTGTDFLEALPDIAWYFDEPVANPSAIPLYFLSREARKHVPVVLSGEGADELFGGYRVYCEPFALDRIRRLPRPIRAIAAWLGRSSIAFRGRNYLRRASTPLQERYFGGGYGTFTPAEVRRLLGIVAPGEHLRPGRALATTMPGFDSLSESQRMQLIDINYWLWGDILAKADRMSMAHSLELRVPFLDSEVAAVSSQIPDSLKYRDRTTKWILRQAFRGRLPQSTVRRQKLGFPTPLRHWITENHEMVLDLIRGSGHLEDLMDMTYVEELAASHARGKIDATRRLFILALLAAWFDAFMEGDVTAPPSRR